MSQPRRLAITLYVALAEYLMADLHLQLCHRCVCTLPSDSFVSQFQRGTAQHRVRSIEWSDDCPCVTNLESCIRIIMVAQSTYSNHGWSINHQTTVCIYNIFPDVRRRCSRLSYFRKNVALIFSGVLLPQQWNKVCLTHFQCLMDGRFHMLCIVSQDETQKLTPKSSRRWQVGCQW